MIVASTNHIATHEARRHRTHKVKARILSHFIASSLSRMMYMSEVMLILLRFDVEFLSILRLIFAKY